MISVSNLSKIYKSAKKSSGISSAFKSIFRPEYLNKVALNQISFELTSGEIVGLIGANGAGKTTIMKILSGIIYPTTGNVNVAGFNPTLRQKGFKFAIALVMGQRSQLNWDLSALDSFRLLAAIYDFNLNTMYDRINALSTKLSVANLIERQVRTLSLGERMKVEIIASLLHQPKIILFDEPTLGLDISSQKQIRSFIKDYARDNQATILLTSHYMDDIEQACKRVIAIKDGSIVYDGETSNLVKQTGDIRKITIAFDSIPSEKLIEKLKTEAENNSLKLLNSDVIEFDLQSTKLNNLLSLISKADEQISDLSINPESFESIAEKIITNRRN